jgi:hypothetical protein
VLVAAFLRSELTALNGGPHAGKVNLPCVGIADARIMAAAVLRAGDRLSG